MGYVPENDGIRTFVIHVRGNTERYEHMRRTLDATGLAAEFILDGNREDLDEKLFGKLFTGRLACRSNDTSCVYKHLTACRRIVEEKIPRALILEDDITPLKNYREVFPRCLDEMVQRRLSRCLISLENSGHRYVRKSERVAGQYLYRENRGPCAGAYILDGEAAAAIVRYAEEHGIGEAFDLFHNRLMNERCIEGYWLEPPVFEQASNSGRMNSLLEEHKKDSVFKRVRHDLRRWFRKTVANLR